MTLDPEIEQKAMQIRQAIEGVEIRESLAKGIEFMDDKVNTYQTTMSGDWDDVTQAENARVSAEQARVQAENTRQANEANRQTAEASRVTAETARETAFAGMQHIDANAELSAAREGKDSLLLNLQDKDSSISNINSQLAEKVNQADLNVVNDKTKILSNNMGTCQPIRALWAQAEKGTIRNLNDFDTASGISYSLGEFYTTTSGTLGQAVKALQDTNVQNVSVQALIYYDNTQDSAYIGFSTSARGAIPTSDAQHKLIGFRKDAGFIYNDGNTLNTLVTSANLTSGWYELSFILLNTGTTCIAIISINKQGTSEPQTFLNSTPYINNILIQSLLTSDRIKNIKYASLINSTANLLIPNLELSKNFHTPLQFTDNLGIGTVAYIPASYNPNIKNKCIIFFHGLNGQAKNIWNTSEKSLTKGFLDAGYVVIASDYTSNTCWGNAQSSVDTDNLITLYQNYLNIQNEYYLLLESMGGITGLNAIAHSQNCKAKAAIGIYPATNLTSLYDNGNGGMAGSIATAYGVTDPSQFATKTNGYDPMLRDGSIYKDIPMLFWSSYEDTVVPRATNSDAFATRINALGGNVTVNTSTGSHGDASNFVPTDAVNFFNKY